MASRRRSLQIVLVVLALFLVGTLVVLSSISFYLSINTPAYLTEEEVGSSDGDALWNATAEGKVERIPRILHQTWKSETLPERWKDISQECRDMMPDYEYMLWTDAGSRDFIAKEYPWFLDTFDSYTYPIQRADAIRYFVLHYYGGVYLDLDVGCRRPLDRLLVFPVILPKTIPVGVSNDLMFAEKGHPFMAQTIHNLVTFDHSWILNYPTVMFSTGPMFLSAQYGIWTSSHSPTREFPGGEVRILPKSLYGKNAKPEEAPHAFFSHYYGSSWHADDAAFIGFLGKWGKGLMIVGFVLLIIGIANLLWKRNSKRSDRAGRSAGYEVLLPRSYQRNGRWHLDLGPFTLSSNGIISSSSTSESSSPPLSPVLSEDEESVPMLPLSFDVRPLSPSGLSEASSGEGSSRRLGLVETISRVGSRVVTSFSGSGNTGTPRETRHRGRSSSSRRGWQRRGVLFFLPAIFSPSTGDIPTSSVSIPSPSRSSHARSTSRSSISKPLLERASSHQYDEDLEAAASSSGLRTSQLEGVLRSPSRTPQRPSTPLDAAPPPYQSASGSSVTPTSSGSNWQAEEGWDEWDHEDRTKPRSS